MIIGYLETVLRDAESIDPLDAISIEYAENRAKDGLNLIKGYSDGIEVVFVEVDYERI